MRKKERLEAQYPITCHPVPGTPLLQPQLKMEKIIFCYIFLATKFGFAPAQGDHQSLPLNQNMHINNLDIFSITYPPELVKKLALIADTINSEEENDDEYEEKVESSLAAPQAGNQTTVLQYFNNVNSNFGWIIDRHNMSGIIDNTGKRSINFEDDFHQAFEEVNNLDLDSRPSDGQKSKNKERKGFWMLPGLAGSHRRQTKEKTTELEMTSTSSTRKLQTPTTTTKTITTQDDHLFNHRKFLHALFGGNKRPIIPRFK